MSIIEKAVQRLSQAPAGGGIFAAGGDSRNGARMPDDGGTKACRARRKLESGKPVHEIDIARLQQAGLVVSNAGKSPLNEQFRAIKRPLIHTAFGSGIRPEARSNLVMVTSSLPGEGKTFCSVNLALSIAMEFDYTVLLVDADVTRPSVLRSLGLQAHAGLTDVVLDRTLRLEDVLLRTSIEALTVLPPGAAAENVTELMASQNMSRLLDELAERYPDRIVIFDAPPLLAASETRVLAGQMGQVVMVVEAEKTTQHALKESLVQLEGCATVGLVFNKATGFAGEENYYYARN